MKGYYSSNFNENVTFAKCNENIKDALNHIHLTSPFKRGNLC